MDDDDIFEDDFLKDLNLPIEIQRAIAEIIPSDDPLDNPDFDLDEYINELFPNEQSLSNIDEVIKKDKLKIKRLDDEIRSIIHNQTESAENGKTSLEDAQKAIMHLFSQIKDIKSKAEKSEEMVKEITRDIKQLDVAKKNISHSITILNHLYFLLEGVEQLEELIQAGKSNQMGEMAGVLERVINVIDHFEPYNHIEHIAELAERVKKIKSELSVKIKKDFEDFFSNPFQKMVAQHGHDLCKCLDVLDQKLKNDLVKWFLKKELSEYTVLFEESQENSWLDKIDRRYSWIKKTLAEFEEKYNKIFPSTWDMSERLAVDFCEITKRELTNIMNKRKLEIDNKLLTFAIQRTTNFEQILTKNFLGRSVPKPANVQLDNEKNEWKPFMGMISQCFDAHFDIFVNYTDITLADLINRFIEDVKLNGFPKIVGEDSSNLHNSAADLFIFYKNCMSQCLQLFTNNTLLCKLTLTFQKYLREYANKVLSNSLPKLSSSSLSSYSSISGAATNLLQNFQIQNMLKESQGSTISNPLSSESKKLNETEICRICSILCTAEYCLDTTQQLEDKLREKVSVSSMYGLIIKLDPKQVELNSKKINLNNEKDIFSGVISNCIQLLVQDLENSCEPALTAMSKISWQTYSTVGDQSTYVTAVINHLKNFVPLVRDNLVNSRKYFTQFCSKFANNLMHKYLNNIFKCKLVSQAGIEQLLLDTHSLKTALMDMPTVNSSVSRKAPSTYSKIILKEMGRAEMILKSLMTPGEPAVAFVDNYLRLITDHDLETFRAVVEMKGYKKNDLNFYLEIFKSKINAANSALAVTPSIT
ncbi:unnamed protein product [Brachionus calyciflorus]|uniref:Vacuolar protein sorting-associated protein 53 homolog n=1 Tax=Brachionus calyciflorus TaxID=104777 RepID=A0A814GKW4_9BILA|nr:unnamed protein product [Brachionus calyciflorus]